MTVKIDGYRLGKIIGQGSTGTVYSALQIAIGRKVAVKILKQEIAEKKENIKSFVNEARTAAMLNHPNIVTGIDVGATRSSYYFIMEMLEGGTFEELLKKKGPLSEEYALQCLRETAEALSYAGKKGVMMQI
ncbi:MAG: protein kinase domain-containing protein [Planctomycetota bacterium]|jgi:serine/threonine-protein kinase